MKRKGYETQELQRVEALLRSAAEWEPDTDAPLGLAHRALSRDRFGQSSGQRRAFVLTTLRRRALVGVGAVGAIAAVSASLPWQQGRQASTTIAPTRQQAAAPTPSVQQASALASDSRTVASAMIRRSGPMHPATTREAALPSTPAQRVKSEQKQPQSGRTPAATPPRRRRPILSRPPLRIAKDDTAATAAAAPAKAAAPKAMWETETVEQIGYGALTPAVVAQQSRDENGEENIVFMPVMLDVALTTPEPGGWDESEPVPDP